MVKLLFHKAFLMFYKNLESLKFNKWSILDNIKDKWLSFFKNLIEQNELIADETPFQDQNFILLLLGWKSFY